MNEQNVKFLRDRMIRDNVIETFLDTVILEEEKFLAIHCIQKNDKVLSDFTDNILLLTDRRIIKLDINSKFINFESYSLKLINSFKMVKTYVSDEKGIRSKNFIEKIIIFLKNKINDKDYLEIEFDEESKRLGLNQQKSNAFEFIKELSKLI